MITIPGIISGFQTLRDGTLKLTLSTNELNPEQSLAIFSLINKFVYAGFKEEPFKNEEMRLLDSMESDFEDKGKTQSQRIRAVLYILFKQNNEGYKEFREYYLHKTNKVIEHYKGMIEE